jgi:endonuclease/exonuclease/phosphatase family metal-dependent hydrolase
MAKTDPNALVVGTWNIRWFARGCSPNESCPENETDVDWLACSIAWMNVDVLAVQEILTSSSDATQLAALLQKLNALSKGSWQSDLQQCGGTGSQHVGFLWNASRVNLTERNDVWDLNPNSSGPTNACAGSLRPGRYARVAAVNGGADFNTISVHLDSGVGDRDYQNRRKSIEALAGIEIDGKPLAEIDIDTIIIGDFNTMGRQEQPAITAEQEIQTLQQELEFGFQRVAPSPPCTEYFDNKGGVLDHIVVSAGMSEAATTARVSGYCAVRACSPMAGTPPPAYEKLSDHCPVLLEVSNTDSDQ